LQAERECRSSLGLHAGKGVYTRWRSDTRRYQIELTQTGGQPHRFLIY